MHSSPRPYSLTFVGSHNIFPYGWSSDEGSVNRSMAHGASLSSVIHPAFSFVVKTRSTASQI